MSPIRSRKALLALLLACAAMASACHHSGGSGSTPAATVPVTDYVSDTSMGGQPGTFHEGSPPASSSVGGPTITVSGNSSAVPGGTAQVDVTWDASTILTKLYVDVANTTGYYDFSGLTGTSAHIVLHLNPSFPKAFSLDVRGEAAGGVSTVKVLSISRLDVASDKLDVNLSWTGSADLDLSLVEPTVDGTAGEVIYWGHTESAAGGSLNADSNQACSIDGRDNENIAYSAPPPAGVYTVRVDNWENCLHETIPYIVTVRRPNQDPLTFSGTFAAADLGTNCGGIGDPTLPCGTPVLQFTMP
jgi:hypothetical protein